VEVLLNLVKTLLDLWKVPLDLLLLDSVEVLPDSASQTEEVEVAIRWLEPQQ